ncbi:MAG: hypothetical protein K6A92_12405 [Lachnospiraceae bacterium]|nr:hypothetical protein [Lachnospiraceae bacterium]
MFGWQTEVRGNTQRIYQKLYDVYGNHVGTISISKTKKAIGLGKKKKAYYNFKQVSAQVLQAKTSTKAHQVSNNIRTKIGLLKKQLKNGDADEEEILRALLHAEMVKRACKKKEKNLKMEETAEKHLQEEPVPSEELIPDAEEAGSREEIQELEMEELRALMEKMQLSADEMKELAEDTLEMDADLEELTDALTGEMTPEDLKELKIKHRSDEARDILKADLKYLKALFERLQSEKQNAGKASATLSLGGGMDMPILQTQEVTSPEIGGTMDIEL